MPQPIGRLRAFIADRVHVLDGDPLPGQFDAGEFGVARLAVVCRGSQILAVVPERELEAFEGQGPLGDLERIDWGDVDLAPGFIDVQVNGGGGALFNESPTGETLRTIAEAHRRFGTTSLLPTFITDSLEGMRQARAAVDLAVQQGQAGILGMHFEGPFLDDRKTGAHDRRHVRPAAGDDLDAILEGAQGVTLVTAAANRLTDEVLGRLLGAGARVALGHCASTYDEACAAFDRGVTGVTHLFNAMSPMEGRAPGLVGAALATKGVRCGLILDGVHVDFGAARAAWRALGSDGMMLVTDAVQPVGTSMTTFQLGGQAVTLEEGRCVNEEGKLAGSALDMASAVRNAVRGLGVSLHDALVMASRTPARFLGLEGEIGSLQPGRRADLVVLGPGLTCTATVVGGEVS